MDSHCRSQSSYGHTFGDHFVAPMRHNYIIEVIVVITLQLHTM